MDIITRDQAIASGLRRFFSNKPCSHGHVAERYTSNSRCVACNGRSESGTRRWERMRNQHPCEPSFREQNRNANRRGIKFLLTFSEWLKVWEDSGHLDQRGRSKHQYCMARFNDIGIYEVGNVEIITNKENHLRRKKYRHTEEFKKELSQQMLGNTRGLRNSSHLGMVVSNKTKTKISKSLKIVKGKKQ